MARGRKSPLDSKSAGSHNSHNIIRIIGGGIRASAPRSSSTLVSLAEYSATTYHPDRDYIDGELVERNVGEWPHSRAQGRLYAFLFQREAEWGIHAVPEQRVQVTPTRFRIPGICVILASDPIAPVLRNAPFLCIEILSKDDTVSELNERLADYFWFGRPLRMKWSIHSRDALSSIRPERCAKLWMESCGPAIRNYSCPLKRFSKVERRDAD